LSDRLSTVLEILKARGGCSESFERRISSRDVLETAVKMACKDATSAAWVHTREQIDGGEFSYLGKSASCDSILASLLEHDIAMSGRLRKQELECAVRHQKRRLGMLPYPKKVVILVNVAQRYNCTNLLHGKFSQPIETQA
jgi:hypothetical protein